VIDSGLVGSTDSHSLLEGFHESRRCSRDTYPESYIIKDSSIRRNVRKRIVCLEGGRWRGREGESGRATWMFRARVLKDLEDAPRKSAPESFFWRGGDGEREGERCPVQTFRRTRTNLGRAAGRDLLPAVHP